MTGLYTYNQATKHMVEITMAKTPGASNLFVSKVEQMYMYL